MEHSITIRKVGERHYIARVAGIPLIEGEGPTYKAALLSVGESVEQFFEAAKDVRDNLNGRHDANNPDSPTESVITETPRPTCSTRDVMHMADVCEGTVHRAVKTGSLKARQRPGVGSGPGYYEFDLQEAQEWAKWRGAMIIDNEEPAIYSTKDVASMAGVSESTVRKAVRDGSLRAVTVPYGDDYCYKYRASEAREWIKGLK